MAKTAIEKLEIEKQPKIVTELPEGVWRWAPGVAHPSMVVSTPKEVNELMSRVKRGKLITLNSLREHLAQKYGTTIACPVSTGIFVNIAAHAAEEMQAQGEKKITPYWRTLKSDGALNEKYPGGVLAQRAKLEAEGFEIVTQKKKLMVKDYAAHLAGL